MNLKGVVFYQKNARPHTAKNISQNIEEPQKNQNGHFRTLFFKTEISFFN